MARLGVGVRKRADGTFEKRFTMNGKRISIYGNKASFRNLNGTRAFCSLSSEMYTRCKDNCSGECRH